MKLKSKCFIALLILCVLFTIGSVSAEANQTDEVCAVDNNQTEILSADGTFEELNESISQAEGELNLTCDYKYELGKICINKSEKFVLNGNGHAIEGIFNCSPFEVESGDMVIFKNLTFRNCNNVSFLFSSSVILNGVKFINCSGDPNYDLILNTNLLELDNCIFQFNDAVSNAIHNQNLLIIRNSLFYGWKSEASFIINDRSNVLIESSTFENISSNNGAVLNFKGCNLTIRKSKFINLHVGLSGGAILGNYYPVSESLPGAVVKPFLIEDCEFINVTSTHDGGAIYFDLNTGADHILKPFNILNSNFTDCTSRFGGAMSLQGGLINIGNCNFIDNFASFEGGALFTTWSNVNLTNTNLFNNSAQKNAGAFYFDKGKLFINKSSLINNKVNSQSDEAANCIYAYDVDAYFLESVFDNGGVSVYADFATDSKLVNVTKNSDIFLLDNKNYVVSIESNGIKFNLTKNEIIVDKLPPKFDPRNYGWISPNKKQGDNYDCWAFATVSSIESSFLRATGVLYDLSQNYVQELQLKYYPLGDLRVSSTGFAYSGLGYALSWIGTLPADNPYDDRGMISDTDFADARIHVQDAMIIFGGRSDTIDLIKQAVLKYGPVTVQICENGPVDLNTTGDDIAVPDHGIHFFSIIGWDDNYSTSGTLGSWLVKDSLSGDFDYRSFDDPAILGLDYCAIVPQNAGICYIFENTIDYHVNYQTDLTALTGFDGNYTYYSNEFISKYDELIGAVGTYFNESGIDYSFDVYVHGVKVHSQNGVSEFAGFRTIVLNKYIPIKTGDKFKVVFKNNALPYQAYSRVHYIPGMTFVSADGNSWSDITLENKTVCLKVYTVTDDTKVTENKDIIVDYGGGSYFTVKVVTADGRAVGAGAEVTFTINGVTTTVKTDNDGIAKLLITDTPNTYAITTSYKGQSFINTVVVKQVLTTTKVTVKKTAKRIVLKATLAINGKPAQGKTVKFTFGGKTYSAVTNANGVAQVNVPKSVLNKLKNNKNYEFSVTYIKDTIKSTVKASDVIVLKANKVTVKKTAKKFVLKATLKINGKAVKGKKITFKFKGKTYKAKTNKKGIAKKVLKKNVIKKLKKGKTYKVKVTYLKTTKLTSVKVKR